jgi:hypothetical protein
VVTKSDSSRGGSVRVAFLPDFCLDFSSFVPELDLDAFDLGSWCASSDAICKYAPSDEN